MKEVEIINKAIANIPRGKLFTAAHLAKCGSYTNIRQALSRLAAQGEITRATRGIYVRPKTLPYLGEVMPSSNEIIKAISMQTGEVITPHGAEAARQLNLSTQAPVRPIFNTSGTSREIKVCKQTITLKHISARKQVLPGSIICLVIAALWYLGKNNINEGVISKIKEKLSDQQFVELLKHTNKMPHWMANAFHNYQ